jgi:L-glyceraldehyde 3-phosphate reductase
MQTDMTFRRSGVSGLQLPAITLGLWQNFGSSRSVDVMTSIVYRAFDLGVIHFDLANNYGPPPGHAEEVFGSMLTTGLRGHRDELIISTKAGYDMWSGPYGSGGSRKHVLASLDQSLRRLGVDYVDIFYSHRLDPTVPIDETMGALADAVQAGKAVYAGISSYSPDRTREAAGSLLERGRPLTIHQPSYSMFNRWIEHSGLLDTLEDLGVGCIGFSVLAQGMLTDRYLNGVPPTSRASRPGPLNPGWITDEAVSHIRVLATIADTRGQSLSQMAIAWTLRDPRVTSALLGASTVEQLEENVAALDNLGFTSEELSAIDEHAVELEVDLWKRSRTAG